MKKFWFLLILVGGVVSFNKSIASEIANPVRTACGYVYSSSMLGGLAALSCVNENLQRIENGESEPLVVADICDELSYIPENSKYVRPCFEKSLPKVTFPEGYPKPRPLPCERYAREITKKNPTMVPVEKWQCTKTVEKNYRYEVCYLEFKDSKTGAKSLRNQSFTVQLDQFFAWQQDGNAHHFNLETGEFSLPTGGDVRVLWGKMKKLDSSQIDFNIFYHQPWSPTYKTNHHLDKVSKSLKITTCEDHVFSCEEKSSSTLSCERI